jgi:hypothetical protein
MNDSPQERTKNPGLLFPEQRTESVSWGIDGDYCVGGGEYTDRQERKLLLGTTTPLRLAGLWPILRARVVLLRTISKASNHSAHYSGGDVACSPVRLLRAPTQMMIREDKRGAASRQPSPTDTERLIAVEVAALRGPAHARRGLRREHGSEPGVQPRSVCSRTAARTRRSTG